MKTRLPSKRKWKRRDLIIFLEKLELYASSGLPVDKAFAIAAESASKAQKPQISMVLGQIESGSSISSALSSAIRMPKTLLSLIRQGESSGELANAFRTGRILLEKEDELLKRCASAMAYPAIIGAFAVLLTLGLMRGVMPQIIPLLKSLNVQLPLITRIVIFLSDGLLAYGLYALVIVPTLLFVAVASYRRMESIRRSVHRILLHIPIIGPLLHEYSLSVFLRSCGSLIQSGIPAHYAYESTVGAISFLPLRAALSSKSAEMSKGISLSTAFIHRRIPRFVPGLVSAGEVSGTLGTSILRAADILDRDIDHMLKRLTALIEPVMMAAMGCTVGAIAVSIMMPIYDISKVLQH